MPLSEPDRRIHMIVAYDGTGYHGWQLQPPGAETVQGVLERVLGGILEGDQVRITGAGRTDAGVHALGQAAHFDTSGSLACEIILRALNAGLPRDIRVLQVEDAPDDFHARYSAASKLYRYNIADKNLPETIFLERTNWVRSNPLDPSLLERCASMLVGEHDFFTFSKKEGARPDHRCRVFSAGWECEAGGGRYCFEITGDRFLRGMVRMLVGGMTAVAEGRAGLEEFRTALERPARWLRAVPAPACGLFLVKVNYPE